MIGIVIWRSGAPKKAYSGTREEMIAKRDALQKELDNL